MKQFFFKCFLSTLFLVTLYACESDKEEPQVQTDFVKADAYILNQGNWEKNDASLSGYDMHTFGILADVFKVRNESKEYKKIGDTGQDLLIYGSKMYITVTESSIIFVTDLEGRILERNDGADAFIKPTNDKGQDLKPHSLIAHNGKVYVSLYGGYVAQIDTTQLQIENKIQVGSYPEQMTIVDNILYVVNTRSPANTLSVIDLNGFVLKKAIQVVENPTNLTKDMYGNIYIISMGNYETIKPTLQKLDKNTQTVTTIAADVASSMTIDNNRLLLIYKDPKQYPAVAKLWYYDIDKNILVDKSFVTGGNANLSDASHIDIDPSNRDIYITTNDYVNQGNIYVFSSSGVYLRRIETKGYNPVGIFFVPQNNK